MALLAAISPKRILMQADAILDSRDIDLGEAQNLASIVARLTPELTRIGFILKKFSKYKRPLPYDKFQELGELPQQLLQAEGTEYVTTKKEEKLKRIYTGEWMKKAKVPHGIGSFVTFDGEMFEGKFEMGEAKGYGRSITASGNVYEGIWEKGKFSGMGRIHIDGRKYDGDTLNQLPHGSGKLTLKNGTTYIGDFSAGAIHGKGVLTVPGKYTYKGQFIEGVIDGVGRFEWTNGEAYEGEVAENEVHGKGVYTWPNGMRFEGMMEHKVRTGFGIMLYADKSKYEGYWRDDQKHGEGVLWLASGVKQIGFWDRDKLLRWEEESYHAHILLESPKARSGVFGEFECSAPQDVSFSQSAIVSIAVDSEDEADAGVEHFLHEPVTLDKPGGESEPSLLESTINLPSFNPITELSSRRSKVQVKGLFKSQIETEAKSKEDSRGQGGRGELPWESGGIAAGLTASVPLRKLEEMPTPQTEAGKYTPLKPAPPSAAYSPTKPTESVRPAPSDMRAIRQSQPVHTPPVRSLAYKQGLGGSSKPLEGGKKSAEASVSPAARLGDLFDSGHEEKDDIVDLPQDAVSPHIEYTQRTQPQVDSYPVKSPVFPQFQLEEPPRIEKSQIRPTGVIPIFEALDGGKTPGHASVPLAAKGVEDSLRYEKLAQITALQPSPPSPPLETPSKSDPKPSPVSIPSLIRPDIYTEPPSRKVSNRKTVLSPAPLFDGMKRSVAASIIPFAKALNESFGLEETEEKKAMPENHTEISVNTPYFQSTKPIETVKLCPKSLTDSLHAGIEGDLSRLGVIGTEGDESEMMVEELRLDGPLEAGSGAGMAGVRASDPHQPLIRQGEAIAVRKDPITSTPPPAALEPSDALSYLSYALQGQDLESSLLSRKGLKQTTEPLDMDVDLRGGKEGKEGGREAGGISSEKSFSSLSASLCDDLHFLNRITPSPSFNPSTYLSPGLLEKWMLLQPFPYRTLTQEKEPPTVAMQWLKREAGYYRGYLDAHDQFTSFGLLLTNDSISEGQWSNSQLHGLGRKVTQRQITTGYWVQGRICGFATCLDSETKTVYSGDWLNSQPNGRGFRGSSEASYLGEFSQGVETGLGKLVTRDMRYEGEFHQGTVHGFGRAIFSDGSQYVGSWKHGIAEGLGVRSTRDKEFFYGRVKEGRSMEGHYMHNGERLWKDFQK